MDSAGSGPDHSAGNRTRTTPRQVVRTPGKGRGTSPRGAPMTFGSCVGRGRVPGAGQLANPEWRPTLETTAEVASGAQTPSVPPVEPTLSPRPAVPAIPESAHVSQQASAYLDTTFPPDENLSRFLDGQAQENYQQSCVAARLVIGSAPGIISGGRIPDRPVVKSKVGDALRLLVGSDCGHC